MTIALFANVFASHLDFSKAGARARKIKKARKAREQRKSERSTRTNASQTKHETNTTRASSSPSSASSSASKSTYHASTVKQTTSSEKTTEPRRSSASEKPKTPAAEKTVYSEAFIQAVSRKETKPSVKHEPTEAPKEPDENTPKSKPKHERDQYICKRMIIAGSSYCDASVLEKLSVGIYFDLEAEPNNPHDKDAIALVYHGEKIGYIAKQDKAAFVTCLRLDRRVYGVITDIITDSFPTKYEYETWFDSEGKG